MKNQMDFYKIYNFLKKYNFKMDYDCIELELLQSNEDEYEENTECLICMDTFESHQMKSFHSNNKKHALCEECLMDYINNKCENDLNIERFQCAEPNCQEIININY